MGGIFMMDTKAEDAIGWAEVDVTPGNIVEVV